MEVGFGGFEDFEDFAGYGEYCEVSSSLLDGWSGVLGGVLR